jgi:DNA polymerase-3 subunit delta
MVDQLAVKRLEDVIFALADHVAERKLDRALTTYHDLLSQKEQPVVILILLGRHLRLLLQTLELSRLGYPPNQIAAELKLAPFIMSKYTQQARLWKVDQLRRLLDELAEIDFAIKTSRAQDVTALETFIMKAIATRN